jgi:uncharacterized protein YcbX
MTLATIKQLFIHPVKGLSPQDCHQAVLEAGHGIQGDRAFALMFVHEGQTIEAAETVPWQSKKYFAVQNDWPSLAALKCDYDPDTAELTVGRRGEERIPLLVAKTNTTQGRAKISAFFTEYLRTLEPTEAARHPQHSPLQLVGSSRGETRYSDRESGHISLISQGTLNEISRRIGTEIDIRRFRPNIVLDGVPAWGEFDWVGKELQLGESRILVSAPIGRCVNIEVNPETGDRDLPLCRVLPEQFGHLQTGVVAKVLSGGTIQVGDRLQSDI